MICRSQWVERFSTRGHPYRVWEAAVPRIPDNVLDCVIYLYADRQSADDGIRLGGSGFLTGVRAKNADGFFLYAVTNKHLIERGYTAIRLTTKDGNKDVIETTEMSWIAHDTSDLSICPIALSEQHKFNLVDEGAFVTEQMVGGASGIGPGDDVFVVGRFINHEGQQRNLPTVRFGNVAQLPWEPIDGQESFLVEARSIPGYSGSAVFVHFLPFQPASTGRPSTNLTYGPWLLGIDWGHIHDWEPLCGPDKKPLNPVRPKDRQIRINTGMMTVIPAWKLAELLAYPTVSKIREQEEQEALEKKAATKDSEALGQ